MSYKVATESGAVWTGQEFGSTPKLYNSTNDIGFDLPAIKEANNGQDVYIVRADCNGDFASESVAVM